jgi:hypothetical protein
MHEATRKAMRKAYERYEFRAPSWAGVFGSTMSEAELQALWEEVRAERALWFWAWEDDRVEPHPG